MDPEWDLSQDANAMVPGGPPKDQQRRVYRTVTMQPYFRVKNDCVSRN